MSVHCYHTWQESFHMVMLDTDSLCYNKSGTILYPNLLGTRYINFKVFRIWY